MKVKYPIGGYAPGHYTNKCVNCKEDFMGDKLARQCEPCAINAVNQSSIAASARVHELESQMKKIKEAFEIIVSTL